MLCKSDILIEKKPSGVAEPFDPFGYAQGRLCSGQTRTYNVIRKCQIVIVRSKEMKFIICLAVATLIFGCNQSPKKGIPVSVGMAWEEAEPILTSAGAMHVEMDKIADTETHIVEVNKFPNGALILIEISIEYRTITELKVCTNPGQPEEQLTWKSVKEFYVGGD